jgi:hypothetical protein
MTLIGVMLAEGFVLRDGGRGDHDQAAVFQHFRHATPANLTTS